MGAGVSGRAAIELGVNDRGLLRAGQAADVVLFDAGRVRSLEQEFVADLPGGGERWIQRAEGIEAVIVNGESVLERGEATGRRSGRTLRG
jgi:N-acyl-D-aspartate/D-glutamate deacylase